MIRGQRPNIRTKGAPSTPALKKFTGVLGALYEEPQVEIKYNRLSVNRNFSNQKISSNQQKNVLPVA